MAETATKEKYHFRRELEEIEATEGRGTELVSVYVPPDKQISDVANYLRNEYSQSENIKSTRTRKNVTTAIDSILSRLKQWRHPPPHGLVFFVGAKALGADQYEMVAHVIEPPEPVQSFIYRCDSKFYTAPLRDMLAEKEVYGLLVIDRSEATLGILRGKRIEGLKNIQSLVPSKHSRGGQSARRFERLIELAAHEFYKKVGDLMFQAFGPMKELRAILIGGPGYTKEYFAEQGYINHELKKKVLPTYFDVGYTDESGLRELVEAARDALAEIDLMREKRLMQRLMEEIRKPDGGLAVYGEEQVRHALGLGAVDTLLVSEGLRRVRAKVKCPTGDYEAERTLRRAEPVGNCPRCGNPLQVVEQEDVVEELYRLAEGLGTKVELISEDSEEGQLLMKAFGGLAGILRYRVT